MSGRPLTTDRIESAAALERVIGRTPPAIDLKVIDHLDDGALRWIAASPLAFTAFGDGKGVVITPGGGRSGFAGGDRATLRLPLSALDDPSLARPGSAFGSLFLAPGIGETLRVNGHVARVGGGEAVITVTECYVHCAKALIRSDFWSAAPTDDIPDEPVAFVSASSFMALATIDATGRADLSPKGDPADALACMDGDCLWFADRPGNRRADSFRNILSQPRIAAALLIPGSPRLAIVTGRACLTSDAAIRARFTVQGKVPLLAVGVEDLTVELRTSPALAGAQLWPAGRRADGIDPARMFASHVRLNKDKGLAAKLAAAVVSIPGLMQKGLDKDYKSNLY